MTDALSAREAVEAYLINETSLWAEDCPEIADAILALPQIAGAMEERDAAITDSHDRIADLNRDLDAAEKERDAYRDHVKELAGLLAAATTYATWPGAQQAVVKARATLAQFDGGEA